MSELLVKVLRYDPETKTQGWAEYKVEYEEGMTVLSVLNKIYRKDNVSFRHSCDAGLCKVCLARVNGKERLTCKEIVTDPTEPLIIEPSSKYKVVKDLVFDWDTKGE